MAKIIDIKSANKKERYTGLGDNEFAYDKLNFLNRFEDYINGKKPLDSIDAAIIYLLANHEKMSVEEKEENAKELLLIYIEKHYPKLGLRDEYNNFLSKVPFIRNTKLIWNTIKLFFSSEERERTLRKWEEKKPYIMASDFFLLLHNNGYMEKLKPVKMSKIIEKIEREYDFHCLLIEDLKGSNEVISRIAKNRTFKKLFNR